MEEKNAFLGLIGTFEGHGINHENQTFLGSMSVTHRIKDVGISFSFKATGKGKEVYHEEIAIVGNGPDNSLQLTAISNNTGIILDYILANSDPNIFIFQHGNLENKNEFRERRIIRVHNESEVSYSFWWGLPSGDFQERSSVKMRKK